ncbi:Peptidase M16 inactive domain protein [Candidatus Izimaplasma bacterium HR1]|jgi:predicted Zn-dependent peptidase|uniref:EF-P 5-aminopentanol modification-associated protein YfmF n=1 Tax=Candidatus Izimoplasma sp. HR1 TaxID=1541959 RepID=UPI0004F91A99|nr:Peptidase M16 inactive domain protein [Candidatus Izimaplasma bacterium HR1]
MKIKHIKQDNFNINILETKKFKTTRVEITFANHLTKENTTRRALLPYLLKSITTIYPTRSSLQIALEDMYSAGFGAGIKKVGLTQIITFDLSIINNKYTFNNEDLFLKGIDFLKEIIFNPQFNEEIFNEEKRLLNEYFKGVYANKMRYSVKEALNSMYKGELYNIDAYGNEEELETLTLEECIEAYNDMINNDTININIVGDINADEIKTMINKELNFKPRANNLVLIDNTEKPLRDHEVIIESQNVSQAKLVIGYQFPVYYSTDEYYQAIVLNTLIGGGPESLLFKKIREDLSLVYFIGSAYDQNKGSFMIYSGINQDHYGAVVEEVGNVINNIVTKNYEDKFLTIAKKGIISGLLQSFDNGNSLISRLNSLSLFDKKLNLDELIRKVNDVTKEQLADLGQLITRDITYLLRNDNHENN